MAVDLSIFAEVSDESHSLPSLNPNFNSNDVEIKEERELNGLDLLLGDPTTKPEVDKWDNEDINSCLDKLLETTQSLLKQLQAKAGSEVSQEDPKAKMAGSVEVLNQAEELNEVFY